MSKMEENLSWRMLWTNLFNIRKDTDIQSSKSLSQTDYKKKLPIFVIWACQGKTISKNNTALLWTPPPKKNVNRIKTHRQLGQRRRAVDRPSQHTPHTSLSLPLLSFGSILSLPSLFLSFFIALLLHLSLYFSTSHSIFSSHDLTIWRILWMRDFFLHLVILDLSCIVCNTEYSSVSNCVLSVVLCTVAMTWSELVLMVIGLCAAYRCSYSSIPGYQYLVSTYSGKA